MATHSSITVWKSHGQRNLVDYSPLGRKESDMTEQLTAMQTRTLHHHLRKQFQIWCLGALSSTREVSGTPGKKVQVQPQQFYFHLF